MSCDSRLSSTVVRELSCSCPGFVLRVPIVIRSCPGFVGELSFYSRSSSRVVLELSWSCLGVRELLDNSRTTRIIRTPPGSFLWTPGEYLSILTKPIHQPSYPQNPQTHPPTHKVTHPNIHSLIRPVIPGADPEILEGWCQNF